MNNPPAVEPGYFEDTVYCVLCTVDILYTVYCDLYVSLLSLSLFFFCFSSLSLSLSANRFTIFGTSGPGETRRPRDQGKWPRGPGKTRKPSQTQEMGGQANGAGGRAATKTFLNPMLRIGAAGPEIGLPGRISGPPPSGRVSRAPGAAQTPKLDDFRPPKNQPDIALTRHLQGVDQSVHLKCEVWEGPHLTL